MIDTVIFIIVARNNQPLHTESPAEMAALMDSCNTTVIFAEHSANNPLSGSAIVNWACATLLNVDRNSSLLRVVETKIQKAQTQDI